MVDMEYFRATSTHHLVLNYLNISQPSAKRSVSLVISQPSVSQQEEHVSTTWSVISYLMWEKQFVKSDTH